MPSVSVTMVGQKKLEERLRRIRSDADAEIKKFVRRRAPNAEKRAKRLAPGPPTPPGRIRRGGRLSLFRHKRTGELRRGISARIFGGGLFYEVRSTAEHSLFIEFSRKFGTKFLRPTYRLERRTALRHARAVYIRVVKRHSVRGNF